MFGGKSVATTEPDRHSDLVAFRRYWSGDDELVCEGRRRGLDAPRKQMKELYELMSKAVPDDGREIEVVMTVRSI
ncbi:hypothetical protein MOKP106_40970 [Mycobacterium avium subsp. hominissuis]